MFQLGPEGGLGCHVASTGPLADCSVVIHCCPARFKGCLDHVPSREDSHEPAIIVHYRQPPHLQHTTHHLALTYSAHETSGKTCLEQVPQESDPSEQLKMHPEMCISLFHAAQSVWP